MIALGSRSYPFLGIARHYGVEYGVVLAYADAQRKIRVGGSEAPDLDYWETLAIKQWQGMNDAASVAVIEAVDEMLRQKGET